MTRQISPCSLDPPWPHPPHQATGVSQEIAAPDYFSERFSRFVRITHHARKSMEIREIDHYTLYKVIEEGKIKKRDGVHLWIYLQIRDRVDNLICAAVVMADAVIIKTVMINWTLEDEP